MELRELATLFFNHRHSGTHPDARRLSIGGVIGVAGSIATVLVSPNGTRYILGVDSYGALTTELFTKAGSLFTRNSNGDSYIVGVDTDGTPTTEPYAGSYGAYVFVKLVVLTDSLGNDFNLEVLDDGTLSTNPA